MTTLNLVERCEGIKYAFMLSNADLELAEILITQDGNTVNIRYSVGEQSSYYYDTGTEVEYFYETIQFRYKEDKHMEFYEDVCDFFETYSYDNNYQHEDYNY